jgi:hypothetical protein
MMHPSTLGILLGWQDPQHNDEAGHRQRQLGHLCQIVEVPEPALCCTDRDIAYVMFNIQHSVILPAVKILFW